MMNLKHKKNKHILIIGGMGPQASVYAHHLLINESTAAGADDNQSYPRITHLSINVKDFISQPTYRDEAREYILRCLREIDLTTVDAAFIACNTAHVLADDITEATDLPLVSLMEVTREYLEEQPGVTLVGVLATPATIETGLYQKAFGDRLSTIHTDTAASHRIEGIIRGVLAGADEPTLRLTLQEEADKLRAKGAQRIILGCTELSLLGAGLIDSDIDIVDPLNLVARKIVTSAS